MIIECKATGEAYREMPVPMLNRSNRVRGTGRGQLHCLAVIDSHSVTPEQGGT